ncbi:MAG: ATP-binding protein [Gemmatimonadales bacterium]|nr:ATP-binding protein [Gemmatimonadales bacterium]
MTDPAPVPARPQDGRGQPLAAHAGAVRRLLRRVIVFAGLALAGLTASSWLVSGFLLRTVERDQEEARVRSAQLLLARRLDALRLTTGEFGIWTEAWNFAAHPEGRAAAEFTEVNFVDWVPHQYGSTAVLLWGHDRRLLFHWAASRADSEAWSSTDPALFPLIDRRLRVGGLVRTTHGLYLVGGSVIVRTEDQSARGRRNGYVVFAQVVTDSLLRVIGGELQEAVSLTAAPSDPADTVPSHERIAGDSAETRFREADLYGEPTIVVQLRHSDSFVGDLRRWSLVLLGSAALVVALGLVLLAVSGGRLVAKQVEAPLSAIAGAFADMRQTGRLGPIAAIGGSREWEELVATFNRAIESHHESEQKYRTVFDRGVDALFLLDPAGGEIVDANPAAEALAGSTRAELAGTRLAERLDPAPGDALPSGSFRFHGASASVPVGVVSALVELDGKPTVLVSVHDLTEREAIEAQLRHAQKMEAVGGLAAGIAHDFNNLLTTIVATAELIRSETPPTASYLEDLESLKRAGERGSELTRKLLAFTRQHQLTMQTLKLAETVADFARMVRRMVRADIELQVHSRDPDATVHADPGAVDQILMNLVTNARDAMPNGGTLTIDTGPASLDAQFEAREGWGKPGEYVVLAVSDTGAGMSDETKRRAFEPFFTTKPAGVGTGLGLAIVYGLAKQHRGYVDLYSELGHGTTFKVYFPEVAAVATAAEAPVAARPVRGGTETILLAEDEDALRRAATRVLAKHGYTVLAAADGAEALELFEANEARIALVVSDVVMPRLGGPQLMAALREKGKTPKFLFTSGYTARDVAESSQMDLDTPFLTKPWSITDLLRRVRDVLDGTADS